MLTAFRFTNKILLIPGFLLFLLPGCSKKSETVNDIPYVAVSFSINPNSTEYINLNTVDGSEYLTGGYKGILVFRKSVNEFVSFERACPYDWQNTNARILVDTSGITAYCPVCKSKYILLDGTPFKGPSRYPLKQYQSYFDGTNLIITN
jgi:hypothetical protein